MTSNNTSHVVRTSTSFLRRIIANPFKTYFKMSGITFGLVAVSNFATALFDSDRRKFLIEHSQIFSSALLTKSCYFGALWPAFYITAVHDPKDVLILGATADKIKVELEQVSK